MFKFTMLFANVNHGWTMLVTCDHRYLKMLMGNAPQTGVANPVQPIITEEQSSLRIRHCFYLRNSRCVYMEHCNRFKSPIRIKMLHINTSIGIKMAKPNEIVIGLVWEGWDNPFYKPNKIQILPCKRAKPITLRLCHHVKTSGRQNVNVMSATQHILWFGDTDSEGIKLNF